ncbi:TIM-barrel domain-containing protein [Rhodanobacter sp. KK11]|uniref:TIM-barrel domain-containing protein n=1 Tax=Rhodanobacter sp. KK11 TaxID=3083255 RepID=UPI0029660B2B|nr:TIM-barrel domain-containing protein [Rhodanobacter sp. KK11]MDW2983277.1 glycoside hydrolase family 31 protein [Rhodanobacter sp. KK11]
MTTRRSPLSLALASFLLLATPAVSLAGTAVAAISADAHALAFRIGGTALSVRLAGNGVLHVQALPQGASDVPTLVMDPHAAPFADDTARVQRDDDGATLADARLSARWNRKAETLTLADAQHRPLLTLDLAALAQGRVVLGHARADALYGIAGYDKDADASAGLLRSGAWVAKAGEQGHAGAPFVWSTTGWGVLVDSDGADFASHAARLVVDKLSRPAVDVYLMAGTPPQLFAGLADLSGRTPLFPKWAMGFTNSQWGIDQKELLQIVDTYRMKHIPLDNITLDFDWKAWGEDDYGEFRWNPAKFPDGPGGALAKQLGARGIRLTGIMKPRIHVDTVEGRYASAHGFWVPGEQVSDDYFSHKPVKDIDFDLAAARDWYGKLAIKYGYDHGIAGWWNDEADTVGSDTEFMNMQRALYDSQRAVSDQRVWSINRNFWLGAQRYAYGLWSGDIATGFASMAGQRARMLSAVNVGAMQWGMDGGGFREGTPTPENYARWIQFGAFTPIFRVHGDFGQKRQPWVYGAVAEKAATAAIRLRYALIPYIYSYEHARRASGVGLVRPLLFDWPHDPKLRNDVDSWLFGDWLLVSPVVVEGQAAKDIYLPAGRWTDWFSGKSYDGSQTIRLAIDSKTLSDIPLFVREGAIIPSRADPVDYVGERPLTQLDVDVFPAAQRSTFDYYDDDGSSYDYEHGAYFLQSLSAQRRGDTVRLELGVATGSFKPALRFYLLKVHGHAAGAVTGNGKRLPSYADPDTLQRSPGEGWASGRDRFGAVTWVRIAAGTAQAVVLSSGH